MLGILWIAFLFGVVLLVHLAQKDPADMVRAYVEGLGGRVLSLERTWGHDTRSSTAFHIRYKDKAGRVHVALCQAGQALGVCFTQDQVLYDPVQDELERLRKENAALRKSIGDRAA